MQPSEQFYPVKITRRAKIVRTSPASTHPVEQPENGRAPNLSGYEISGLAPTPKPGQHLGIAVAAGLLSKTRAGANARTKARKEKMPMERGERVIERQDSASPAEAIPAQSPATYLSVRSQLIRNSLGDVSPDPLGVLFF
jgi:hypothetical protein